MNKDYGEILCTAIDEIVTTRIQDIKCDITKMCIVVDDTYSYQGKYVVSDGGAHFEAFSSDNNYKKGNSVLVTIPNGDFNLQKIIVGRVAQTDTTPFKYTSPLDTMLKISDDALKNVKQSEKGLLANQNSEENNIKGTYVKYLSTEGIDEFFDNYKGLSRLGVQADFKTTLEEYDLIEGSYGLKILLYGEELEGSEPTIWELPFSSSDMIGNPYSFNGYFQQEKVFDISSMYNINKMEILFYQNGNFKQGDGALIPYKYIDGIDETIEHHYPRNLFVNNVKIFFGYELDKYIGETLEIYSNSSKSFTAKAPDETKEVILRWIHQNSDQTLTLLEPEDLKEQYSIKWYRYSYGYKKFDKYGGPHWEPLKEFDNEFTIDFLPRLQKTTEELKVVGLIKEIVSDENGENDQIVVTSYYSNILTFKNVIQTVDEVTYKAVSALSIKCLDNSEGNYFIYDQNGRIVNSAQGTGTEKKFEVLFEGEKITKDSGTLGYIKWYLPFDDDGTTNPIADFEDGKSLITNTMIIKNESLWAKDNGIYKNQKNKLYYDKILKDGVDYIGIKREPDSQGNLNTTQSYMIKNYWTSQDANNTVSCEIEIDGIIYRATEELKFGVAGTNGTNTTLVLDMLDGQNAIILNDYKNEDYNYYNYNDSEKVYILCDEENQKNENSVELIFEEINNEIYEKDKYYYQIIDNWYALSTDEQSNENITYYKLITKNALQIRAILYDINGHIIELPETEDGKKDIKWSWYSRSDEDYLLSDLETGNSLATLICNANELPPDNYFILKAECGDNPKLEAYLPIPFKSKKVSYIEGAKEILYDYQGNPSYYSQAYVLYDKNHEEQSNIRDKWILISDEIYDNYTYDSEKKIYTLDNNNGKYKLYFKEKQENDTYKPDTYYLQSEEGKYILSSSLISEDNQIYYICINQSMAIQYLPQLASIKKGVNDYKALKAAPFYAKGKQARICVSCNFNEYGWSQPILIMQNHYNFDVLNQWDNSLTLDENNGIILSTMLGAGRKNEQNQFSGILIGDIQDGTNLNNADTRTGVYGLHNGILSYGLRDDGTAFFGKAGKGQIYIDGNTSTIYSGLKDDNSGMLIDLDDGTIEIKGAYNKESEKQAQILLSSNGEPYFEIQSKKGTSLIHIADDNYYLKSDNYNINEDLEVTKGTFFNLVDGTFFAQSDYGSIELTPKDPYLKITGVKENSVKNLMLLGSSEYYLQSLNYTEAIDDDIITIDGVNYQIYINANNQTVYIKDNKPYYVESGKEIIFELTNDEIEQLKIIYGIGDDEELTEKQKDGALNKKRENYINSLVPASNKNTGLQIDLNRGTIIGYNLYLRAQNGNDDKKALIIDSSETSIYPLTIGQHFKVGWDGKMWCDDIYIGSGKQKLQNYVININDNFVIDANGNGGGSGFHAGSAGFAGSAEKATNADYATKAGTATYASQTKMLVGDNSSYTADGLQNILSGLSSRISALEAG